MPGGVQVEDSHSSDLTNLLKGLGLNATFKKSYTTVSGRKEPDITIDWEGGIFLIEAKVPPAGLPQAMSQLSEYNRSIGLTNKIIGVFAVVYHDKPKVSFEVYSQIKGAIDIQTFSKFPDLAKYILEQISLKEKRAVISTQKIIKILHETVEDLASKLSKESAEEMEDVFRTVLDYDEEEKTAESVLKSAAAYLLVNQILFYHRLVKETASFPEIEPENLHSGEDLQKNYFNRVLRVDYKSIFGFDVALTVGKGEPLESLKITISAIQLLPIESITHDLLGKIFHNLIPLSLRKVVAAYYTNSEAAELLAHLAVEREDAKVIDPACGSGTLLVAAYNAKRERAKSEKAETHIRFLEKEIYGCDIMTFAAHLSAVNLALQAPLKFTNKVNVAIRDSTELAPGIEIESAQEVIRDSQKIAKLSDFDFEKGSRKTTLKKVKKGVIDLLDETRGVKLPKFDVVIMNPPFTRFQRIPKEYKKKLAERFSSSRYKNIVHGQMGLHGYFLLLADKLLAPGGRIAAVLPLTTISLEGFYGVVKLLLSDYQIEHIIVSSGRAAFSENTSLREILLVAKKEKPLPETQTKFTFIHASAAELTVEKAKEIAEKIRYFDGDDEYNNDFYIRSINQYNFNSEIRSLYRTVTLSTPQLVKVDEKLTKWFKPGKKFCLLGDVEKTERWSISENPRGVENKGYYVLSLLSGRGGAERILKDHDVWIIEEETEQLLKVKQRFSGQIFKIPRNCVVPQFRRFSGEKQISLNEPKDYLIVRKFDDLDTFVKASGIANDEALKNIRTGIREGAWEQFVVKNSARLFGFYRGDITAPGSRMMAIRADEPTFAGPGGSWVFKIPQKDDLLVQMYLNSSFVFYHILRDRKETRGGFVELDKYVFLSLPYPIQENVDLQELKKLEKELSKVEFPSILEQFHTKFEPRRKLDLFFLDYAGVDRGEAERFLDLLYETLAKELLKLKGVMGK